MLTLSFVVLLAAATPASSECVTCHEDVVKAMGIAGHATACSGCHAPSAEHLETPSKESVTRIPKEEACLSCHADARQRLLSASPSHHRDRIGCQSCHTGGHAKTDPALACASCHPVQRAKMALPFTHRKGSSAFGCTECHSLHGTQRTTRLALLQRSGACAECHADIAAPRVFEHPPNQVDGCVACHDAHGSTNPRQLQRRNISDLCLECHTDVARFHDISQPKFRACVSCHAAVHGSNRDARLFDQ